MITIEVNDDQLKRQNVLEALIKLLESLNGTESVPIESPVIKKRTPRRRDPSMSPPIDPEIRDKYGYLISKDKSLYFITLVKKNVTIDSDHIEVEMQKYYPEFTRKSIGGITGAIQRWFATKSISLPYTSKQDRNRNGIHSFIWIGFQDSLAPLTDAEKKDLIARVGKKFRTNLKKLLSNGKIRKDDVSNFSDFAREVVNLKAVDCFDVQGDEIIFTRS
jgi:hypothetical protein